MKKEQPYYRDTGEIIHIGDHVFSDSIEHIIEEIFLPYTDKARNFYCERAGGGFLQEIGGGSFCFGFDDYEGVCQYTYEEQLKRGIDLEKNVMLFEDKTGFVDAIIANDTVRIEQLLNEGKSLHEVNFYNQNALHCATVFSDEKMVDFLLSKGADIKARDRFGRDVLSIALFRGKVSLVKHVIETKKVILDINHLADLCCLISCITLYQCKLSSREQFKLFLYYLSHGIKLDVENEKLKACAIQGHNMNIIKHLASKGMKFNAIHLKYALQAQKEKIILWLLNIHKVDVCAEKCNLFQTSIFNSNIKLIKHLIQLGLDIHEKNEFNKTPYELALMLPDSSKKTELLLLLQ